MRPRPAPTSRCCGSAPTRSPACGCGCGSPGSGAVRHDAPDGELLDETWTVSDVDTGLVSEVHLAGDVVLHATAGVLDDEIELAALDGPPWS